MNDRQAAKVIDGKLYRVFRCFGQSFPVYYRYSDDDGNAIPDYPDFEKAPQYTHDGVPFALATQEGCLYAQGKAPDKLYSGECGSCKYFKCESEIAFSIFGLCVCVARQQLQKGRKHSNEK